MRLNSLICRITPIVFALSSALASAQEQGRLPKEDKGIVQWAIGLVLVVLVCLPAFMNPKRSHLD